MTEIGGREIPLVTGVSAGAVAYVLGYVFTYAITSGDLRDSALNQFSELVGGGDITLQLVGWVFYNAHFVSTLVDVPFLGTDAVNFISQGDAFSPVLYLIPVLLLVGAGLAVGRRAPSGAVGDAAVSGAAVVLGYLPLAAVGAFLFQLSSGGSSSGPDLLLAVVLAGVVYPVVFGAVGAVVANQTA